MKKLLLFIFITIGTNLYAQDTTTVSNDSVYQNKSNTLQSYKHDVLLFGLLTSSVIAFVVPNTTQNPEPHTYLTIGLILSSTAIIYYILHIKSNKERKNHNVSK